MSADAFYAPGPATVACVVQAAQRQRVPPAVLLAIGSIEGGRNGQAVRNRNGSLDLGHFQINTGTWARELAPYGVAQRDLLSRGCYNAEVAAYLLARRLAESGGADFWTRAANYHSRTPALNTKYQERLRSLSERWSAWLQAAYPSPAPQQPPQQPTEGDRYE